MSEKYPFKDIELKWQSRWAEQKPFHAIDHDAGREKFYILDMFPYPSGAGLHVGHPEGYTASDIVARYKRMRGFNVLHPMGWDAFGLPAEQYAIETGTHPVLTTKKNIENFRKQITRFGFAYDWDREVNTTDPGYYKWTQWIFLKLFEQGLAYTAEAPVWWCNDCGTVLANEEVIDGKCERKGHPVERKPLRQWMLKITAYAEALLKDLESLDWPEHIKQMQRNWIGKSHGADVWFALEQSASVVPEAIIDGSRLRRHDQKLEFKIYTTRPDTLFGATYMVLSPEHPLIPHITTASQADAVEKYQKGAARKSDLERAQLSKEKSGIFTGAFAVNPVNEEKIPVWIADYVLASYGTGAIMAVPAHDQRDLDFAKTFKLPVRVVIIPEDRAVESGELTEADARPGRMHDSGAFSGMQSDTAKGKIAEWLAAHDLGKSTVQYKLRDWLFSRQRYWGEPIPIIHCKKCGAVPVPENELPLTLPEIEDFRPLKTGEPPLAKATEWIQTTCPRCKEPAVRETNTMPQWAGSCWYYLRYLDPKNTDKAWDAKKEQYWMPVDLYIGGAEHAVLHLLYSRFWHKVLYDLKLVSTPEPFAKLVNQGLILGEDGEKMSKSRGNVVNPDTIIHSHGADAFRLYEMFMGPLEAVKPWNTRSIEGVDRFLNRTWRLMIADNGINPAIQDVPVEGDLKRLLHETIKAVTEDIDGLRLNTAISGMMVLLNSLVDARPLPREAIEVLVLLVAPFAPHIAEELWERLGHHNGLVNAAWPSYDPQALVREEITWVVQVNGKVRARITLNTQVSDEQLRESVLAHDQVKKFVDGQAIKQFIVVPKRLVNIVV